MDSATLAASLFLVLLSWSLSAQSIRAGRRQDDLYDVLGVSRDATQKEIRSSYKRLARQWHPDKNKSPRAQEKILEINKAYEVLSGEESRRRYDMTGETDPAPSGSRGHTHNHGFTFFTSGDGFFHFGGFGSTQPRDDTITAHFFKTVVLEESDSRLWLLYFYGDFCMSCVEVSRLWDELKKEMESVGVGMASVHASRQYGVSSHCSVDSVPAVVAVMRRRVFHYGGRLQARSVRNFVKNSFPSWVIVELTAESVGPFISDSITRNRPRLILFSPHTQPSLLYKSVAFSNRQVADFGFLTTETLSEESQSILKRYNVVLRSKRLLVFKEYPHSSTTLEGSEVTGDALKSVLEDLRLHLPRLSSTHTTETTCGCDGRLCLILVVQGTQAYNDTITNAFRKLTIDTISMSRQKMQGLSLAYIDEQKQSEFLSNFPRTEARERECGNGQRSKDVLLLRIKRGFHPTYAWFTGYCGSQEDTDHLLTFARKTGLKTASIQAPNLLDEFAPGILSRIYDGLVEKWYKLYDFTTKNSQMLSLLTLTALMAGTLCCASIIGTNEIEEESKKRRRKRKEHGVTDAVRDSREIPILNGQLYQQYISEAERGLVSLLILVNPGTPLDFSAIDKHRSTRVVVFWARLDNHHSWLLSLFQQSNMETQEIEKRERFYFSGGNWPRVCVLALFGARKQFAIFPESPGTSYGDKIAELSSNSCTNSDSTRNGVLRETERGSEGGMIATVMESFGFEDEETDENQEEGASERGLGVWMERLEDGSLKRYSVTHWPQWS